MTLLSPRSPPERLAPTVAKDARMVLLSRTLLFQALR
jgi:hypothetical protein